MTGIGSPASAGQGQERLWRNARIATLAPDQPGLGMVERGAILCRQGRIAFAGPVEQLPSCPEADVVDLGGRLVTPGLIDCHTHLVFGGNRAREFELRLAGVPYEEITRQGGGIVSTVEATRPLSVRQLEDTALPRLDALLAEGATTVEIKSGYGLTIDTECNMLRAARALEARRPVRVRTSYLGAHATPPEYRGRNDDYIDEVVLPGLDAAHGDALVDAVDGFCEGIAFSVDEIARVFERARVHGLPIKLHAEQLSNLGGARIAALHGALSADHLEYLDEAGVKAMAAAGTVAVLLPGAFYAMRETRKPPVAALRAARVPIAVATDCNPGTSPLTSLLLAMNMAATLYGLTVPECVAGATREAARALGLLDEIGTIEAGKSADLAIWDAESPAELVNRMGFNPLHDRVFKGVSTVR